MRGRLRLTRVCLPSRVPSFQLGGHVVGLKDAWRGQASPGDPRRAEAGLAPGFPAANTTNSPASGVGGEEASPCGALVCGGQGWSGGVASPGFRPKILTKHLQG